MAKDEKRKDVASVHNQSDKDAKPSSKPAPSVKALGQKARARLKEERTKRSEIKRLDPKEVAIPGPTKKKPPIKRNYKRKRPPTTTTTKFTSRKVVKRPAPRTSLHLQTLTAPTNADLWVPDTSHVVTCTGKDNRSSAVLLHGLPYGTTPWHIRRFFSDFSSSSIESIRILISSHHRDNNNDDDDIDDSNSRTIPEWDAIAKVEEGSAPPAIRRYPPTLRTVVKFDSALTAELAAEQSGEPLDCRDLVALDTSDNDDGDDDEEEKKEQAAIVVTVLRKTHYQLIAQTLSWELKTTKIPLHESLANIEKSIPPHVHEILWRNAHIRLGISLSSTHDQEKEQDTSLINLSTPTRIEIVIRPGKDNSEDYTKLARQRNRLIIIAKELKQFGLFSSEDGMLLDPILAKNPAIHFAHEAYRILSTSIRRLDDWLLLLRRQKIFATNFERMDAMIASINKDPSETK